MFIKVGNDEVNLDPIYEPSGQNIYIYLFLSYNPYITNDANKDTLPMNLKDLKYIELL